MRNLIVFIALVSISSTAVSDEQCVHTVLGIPKQSDFIECRDGYAVGYSYSRKSAEWVSYMLMDRTWNAVKRQDDFRPDVKIPKEYRTYNEDYEEPIYDRGHLAPSDSINFSIEANSDTFLMSNIVPQMPGHNRSIWKGIENYERRLAKIKKSVYVITGVIYPSNKKGLKTIGEGVPVPEKFWKVIFSPSTLEGIGFLTKHEPIKSSEMVNNIASIDEIESASGLDLLSLLVDKIEVEVERKKHSSLIR